MTQYNYQEVSDEVLAIARRAREIYLAKFPRTKAEAWDKLSAEDRYAWIPYAVAAHEAAMQSHS